MMMMMIIIIIISLALRAFSGADQPVIQYIKHYKQWFIIKCAE